MNASSAIIAAHQGRAVAGFVSGPLLLMLLGALVLLVLRFVPLQAWIGAGPPKQQTATNVEPPPAETTIEPRPPVLVEIDPILSDVDQGVEAFVSNGQQGQGLPPKPDIIETPELEPVVEPVVEPPVAPSPVPRKPTTPKPVAAPRTAEPPPKPISRKPATVEKVATVAAAQVIAPKPNLRVLVEAEVDERAGLGAYKQQQYALILKRELERIAVANLGAAAVQQGDANLTFRDSLRQGGSAIDSLCSQAKAQRLLLADLRIPSAGFSSIDSAYWPEVSFVAINCQDGRRHKRPKKRLEPKNQDRFEFQQGFTNNAENFVASQGYFLKP